jgi:hypothetical protein
MNLIGHFPGYPGEVWYNLDGIVNVLSLANAEKYFRVRYDSSKEKAFIVKKADGSIHQFIQTTAGLYYLNTVTASHTKTGTALLLTVADKKSEYSEHVYQQALITRKLQGMIGHPSTWDFLSFVDRNLIPNCPVTRLDILAMEDIFGPSVFFFGSLLVMICIDLVHKWLWDVRAKVTGAEYGICLATFILIQFLGVEYGIIASVALYVTCLKLGLNVGDQKESGNSLASEKNMPRQQKAEYDATTNSKWR